MRHLRIEKPALASNTLALLPTSVGRFGDLREPFELQASRAVRAFRDHASAQGLPLELAVGLAVEHELLLQDAEAAGFDRRSARAQLMRAASAWSETELGPGRPNRAYLDVLRRRTGFVGPKRTCDHITVTIPSRLCERAAEVDFGSSLVPDVLAESIVWERAAVLARRTMTDWGLNSLLVSTRRGVKNS